MTTANEDKTMANENERMTLEDANREVDRINRETPFAGLIEGNHADGYWVRKIS